MASARGSIKWTVPISVVANGLVTISAWAPAGARAFISSDEYTLWVESGAGNVVAGSKTATTFAVEDTATSPAQTTVVILASYVSA